MKSTNTQKGHSGFTTDSSHYPRHKHLHLSAPHFSNNQNTDPVLLISTGILIRKLNPNLHLMKPMILAILSATMLLAASCGLSEKDKIALLQAQQAKDDSIRVAQIKQVKDEDALKSALSDSLSACTRLFNLQQNAMIQLRTSIYTANDEMTQIKAFHFGRLPKDRDDQIRNQE